VGRPRRQVRLGDDLAEQQRGQRGGRRGLDEDGRAHRDRRGHLVRDEVEREVERRDAEHGAAREPAYDGHPAGGGRIGVEPLDVAGEPPGLLGRPPERRDRAGDLAARPHQRLAVLRRDHPGELLGALGDPRRDVVEGRGAYVGGRGLRLVPYGVQVGDGLFDLLIRGHRHLAHDRSVPRRGHRKRAGAGHRRTGEIEGRDV
jgi:hypothetical protein